MTRRPVDVEELVVWTAAELSRRRPDNVHRLPVMHVPRGDRAHVGRWEWPMGYPTASPMFAAGMAKAGVARGDPPHPDAFVVEAAIGALHVGVGAEDEAAVRFGIGFKVNAAAALAAAARNVANLLLVSGRLAKRPSLPAPLRPKAKLSPNGKPGVWKKERWAEPTFGDRDYSERDVEIPVKAKRAGLYPEGAYGALEWEPDPQLAVNDRAEYWIWRAGLAALATALEDKLESRFALAPRAARAPWAGETDDGAIVADLFGAGAPGVYGAEEAASLAAERVSGRRRPVYGGAVYAGRAVKPAKGAAEGG